MACEIKLINGKYVVTNKLGEESNLFTQLKNYYQNEENALTAWKYALNALEKNPFAYTTENGELSLDDAVKIYNTNKTVLNNHANVIQSKLQIPGLHTVEQQQVVSSIGGEIHRHLISGKELNNNVISDIFSSFIESVTELKEYSEQFININTDEDLQELNDVNREADEEWEDLTMVDVNFYKNNLLKYESILNNRLNIKEFALKFVEKITDEDLSAYIEDSEEEIDGTVRGETFDENNALTLDAAKTAAPKLKRYMSFLKRVDKQGNDKYNFVGKVAYASFQDVFNTVIQIVNTIVNNDEYIDAYLKKLKEYENDYDWMPSMIKMVEGAIENNDYELQSAMVNAMQKSRDVGVYVQYTSHPDRFEAVVGKTDTSSNKKTILANLNDKILNNVDLFKNDNGVKVLNQDYFNNVVLPALKKLDNGANLSEETLNNFLNSIGFELKDDTKNAILKLQLRDRELKSGNLTLSKTYNIFRNITDNIKNIDTSDSILQLSNVAPIIDYEEKGETQLLGDSSKEAGKNIYPYNMFKFFNRRFKELLNKPEKLSELNKNSFSKDSIWLKFLNSNDTYSKKFQSTFVLRRNSLDSFKKLKSKKSKETRDLGDAEHEVMKLNAFTNNGNFTNNETLDRKVLLLSPTNSDKKNLYYIQTLAQNLSYDEFKAIDTQDYNHPVFVKLFDIFVLPELRRIAEMQANLNLSGFNNGKNLFYIIPAMNKSNYATTTFESFDDAINDEAAKANAKKILAEHFSVLLNDKLKAWDNEGIKVVKKETKKGGIVEFIDLVDYRYINKYIGKVFKNSTDHSLEEKRKYIALDFMFNHMVSNLNFYQLFSTDPANFYKPVIKSFDEYLQKNTSNLIGNDVSDLKFKFKVQQVIDTFVNLDKRLAGDVAPMIEANWKKNDTFTVLTLADKENVSKSIKFITSYLDGKEISDAEIQKYKNGNKQDKKEILEKYPNSSDYFKIEGGDAQGFTTWQEHLKFLKAYGKDIANYVDGLTLEMLDSIPKILEKDIKDRNAFEKKLIKLVFQPLKPVYNNNHLMNDKHLARMYIKYSSFPLLPEFTKGREIDKLRQYMEDNNVHLTVYKSAFKVGSPDKSLDIYTNDDINIDANNAKLSTRTLSRIGLGLQLEKPYKEDKNKVNAGSQEMKLLFNGILDVKFKNDKTGLDLYKEYINEYKAIYENKLADLKKSLFTDGVLNRAKLKALLKREAANRDYSLNTQFIINELSLQHLWLSSDSKKIDSVLMAIVDNRVRKIKFLGNSYILGSEDGMKVTSNVETLSEVLKDNNTIYTQTFIEQLKNGEGYLKSYHNKNGEIQGTQVLVPMKFRDSSGKLIDAMSLINKQIYEEQGIYVIDENKLSKELLHIFGFRIPTQGLKSMARIEIVGFLPQKMGDLIIASRDFTKQMGSDFDVDALYSYMYKTMQDDNGKLHKVTSELNTFDLLSDDRKKLIRKFNNEVKKAIEEGVDKSFAEETLMKEMNIKPQDLRVQSKQAEDVHLNKIIDIHFEVLSSNDKEIQKEIMTPLSMGELIDLGNAIVAKKQQDITHFSAISDEYQKMKYINATAGKAFTGIFSLLSVTHAVMYITRKLGNDLRLYEKQVLDNGETVNVPVTFTLFGKTFDGKLGKEYALDNKTKISSNIEAYQSSAVDNQKEQILDKLNINTEVSNEINSLIAWGYSQEDVSNFMTQDILIEYVKEYIKATSDLAGYNPAAKENVVKYLRDKYIASISNFEKINTNILNNSNASEAFEMLGKNQNPDNYYVNYQLQVLDSFLRISELSTAMVGFQSAINTDSSGIPKSYIEVVEKTNKVFELLNPNVYLTKRVFINNSETVFNDTINGLATRNALFTAHSMYAGIFPYDSIFFNKVISIVENSKNKKLNTDAKLNLFEDLKSFMFASMFEYKYLSKRREQLLSNSDTNTPLANIVEQIKNKGVKNPILMRMGSKIENNNMYVTFNSSSSEVFNEEVLYSAFLDLLLMEETYNLNIIRNGVKLEHYTSVDLFNDLVDYSYMTGGLQQANQYIKYIPQYLLYENGYFDKLKQLDFNDENALNGNEFIREYYQNNPYEAKDANKIEDIIKPENVTIDTKILEVIKNTDSKFPDYVRLNINQGKKTIPVLFKLTNKSENEYYYKALPQIESNVYFTNYNNQEFKIEETGQRNSPLNKKERIIEPKIENTQYTPVNQISITDSQINKNQNLSDYELFPGVFANIGQKEAIDKLKDFLNSSKSEFLLQGKAGTGKTTIIKKIIETLPNNRILLIAPTHKASKVLKKSINDSEIPSITLAAALAIKLDENTGKFEKDMYAREKGRIPIKFAKYIIIDESSMISDDLLNEINDNIRLGTKIIYMGDKAQLPPVGQETDSKVFTIKNNYELIEKMRQLKNSPIINLGEVISNNVERPESEMILNPIDNNFRINKIHKESNSELLWFNSEDKALDNFVIDFKKDIFNTNNVKIITFNNQHHDSYQSVKNLNLKVREKLYGDLSKNQFVKNELVTAYSTYTVEMGNEKIPVIYNAEDFTIKSIKEAKMKKTISVVSKAKGTRYFEINYDILHLELLNDDGKSIIFNTVPIIAESSKQQYEQDLKELWKTDKQLAYALQSNFADIEYGYAITSHKAQGSTYNTVYVMEDNIMGSTNGGSVKAKNQSMYVAVSRPSKKLVMISNKNTDSNIVEVIDNVQEKENIQTNNKNQFDTYKNLGGRVTEDEWNQYTDELKNQIIEHLTNNCKKK
jgi:exodeoxyribonuclease-5